MSGIQLPVEFARRDRYAPSGQAPPLARMFRGGRGGEVRLKLYLSLILLAAAPPYELPPIPGRAWAETLSLPDPEQNGARRIAQATNWLAAEGFLRINRQPGTPPEITLLNPLGDGKKYKRPMTRYISLPLGFWEQQWITVLTGAATATLIMLLELQGGIEEQRKAPWMSRSRREQYAISDDTWTRATHELEGHGLLTITRGMQAEDFGWRRIRNTYWVHKEELNKEVHDDNMTTLS